MKGFAMLGIGKTGWIEKDYPTLGPMDAICKPLAIAICTSDVHTVYEGAIGDRHDMILGHECTAEVVEVGSEVKDFKPGDRVIVPAITPDWNSLEAQAGFQQHSGGMLAGWKFSNFKDGVFSEYFHVNDADGNLALLPDSMDPVEACMMSDMVPTGFHGAELADVTFGDSVLVIGIGPVGLMGVAGANLKGAGRIIAVGTRQLCRDVATGYGATEFIGYKDGSISEQVLKLTNGKGVDKVIIAGGTVDTFDEAVKSLKPGGRIGSVNYLGAGDYIKIPRVEWGAGMSNKNIVGGLMPGGRLRMEKLASLVTTGKLDLKPLVTHVFDGWEHVPEALELMRNKPADLIKPVVKVY
ncbi:MAG: NAD(P)-dependent alcohol dehydrogenase [Clostridiales bacterium]|nr:NAD(P)-dependent alcohol dehydrogenase [Clostridiales bacterium]MBS5878477.1 NAD(P)-dependent alcohol dehydrogenase [Clostridiales bacterium]MDU0938736.1 NAD(P)-dependent alcohol dehydrogenase [Clostridiales bacterium]MDU1041625.1 NAD(P)-dependent alcohol dehydrogenase [Clostridiales bacterium]MDU3490165.1 NAD(P)-dependent alcohol dehydrogenase [Clostridiales bacterium]